MSFNPTDYDRLKEELLIAVKARKEAERRAQQSGSLYKVLIQHAADAVFVSDFDGHFIDVNYQACDSLGYPREELLQMDVADIVPGFDLASERLRWDKFKLDRPNSFISTHRRKDGSTFPVEVRVTVLDLDGEKLMMAMASDITERKRSESALQESLAFSESLLQTMPVPVFYKNALGQYTGCNSAFAEFIGKAPEDIIGKTVFDISPQQLSAVYRDKDLELLDSPEAVQIYESRVMHADGTRHDVIFHKARIVNSSGNPVGIIGVILDITERKRYEEMQLDLIRQLEGKELAKTRFLASAGHDLRQPVSAASLFVHALKFTSPTQRQNELIEKLDASMKTFSDLLDQLLNISKFDAGMIKPQYTSFNLAELFNWLEHNFSQAALDKQLRFRFYFPMNKQLILSTDIGLLKSVLMNLLSNAIKFTSHGGVLVSARIHGGKVKLQVWDTGIGISEENVSQIFDEFYQVSNRQRSREAGLGLGLSICKRALSVLGGEITCHSRLGTGSVFAFSLPLDGKHSITEMLSVNRSAAEIEDELLIRDMRIVVLEDDELVADGLVNLLQGLGAVVRHFNNAEEALRQDDIAAADCFIVDYSLAGELAGLDFLVALQQRQKEPIHAVVITGETSSEFMRGVVDSPWKVLHKPVSFSSLAMCLRSFAASKDRLSRYSSTEIQG